MKPLSRSFVLALVSAFGAFSATSVAAATIDLSTWSEQGNPSDGTWTVATGGGSVFQSINGDPTFFVSPNNYINTEFNGSFLVETGSDDDFVGFVFGYQSPLAANGDAQNDYSFFLFDWKQLTQNSGGDIANEGFSLSYVNGVVTSFSPFWAHGNALAPDADFQVVATDYGASRGWADFTTYEFTLLYQSNRIKIDIQGGTGDFALGQTIFDINPGAVSGLSEFPDGRFGFYNYSQQSVRYQGFTEEVAPIPIPEPETYALLLAGLGLLGFAARRRRQ
jgi:hypothetical protein